MSCLKLTLALVTVICATDSIRAWDLGVVTMTQIQLFLNKTVDSTMDVRLKNMGAVAYDPIKKDLYVSDSAQKIGSIFRIKTTGETAYNIIEPIVAKQSTVVQGMAFDHVNSTLYWTTGNGKTINYVHVPENTTKVPLNLTGKVLFKFDDELPWGIAIDSCRRFLYWTNINHLKATIERSHLDGSGRQVIVDQNLFMPLGIAVDVENNMLYWCQELEGISYNIESTDLRKNGSRYTLVDSTHQQPYAVALGDRNIYWIDWSGNAVWTVPKNSFQGGVSPVQISKFQTINTAMGLFTLSGNTTRVNETHCKMEQIPNVAEPSSLDPLRDYCKNNGVLHSNGTCVCQPGFAGEYCQLDACDGYCAAGGTCSTDGDGRPTCKCPMTSYGDRCERELCAGRCQNGAQCELDETGAPRCACPAGFAGDACEYRVSALNALCLVFCQHASPMVKSQQSSVCRCEQYDSRQYKYSEMAMLNHPSPCKESKSMMAIVAILTVFVASLGTITMVLAKKVRMLGRRPRIKKRIVVNKSITPLTNRPPQQQNQQCEITIENCCNMNICETPCFEPDFRSPKMVGGGLGGGLISSLQSKSKKEDKAKLLSSTDVSSEDEKPIY